MQAYRTLAAAMSAAAVFGLGACTSRDVNLDSISNFEQQVRMPAEAWPIGEYARFYAPPRQLSAGDLPFTTIKDSIPGLELGRSRKLATAIYIRMERPDAVVRPGVQLVKEAEFPKFFHGGCTVINVIYNPANLRTVDAWCNVEFFNPPLVQ